MEVLHKRCVRFSLTWLSPPPVQEVQEESQHCVGELRERCIISSLGFLPLVQEVQEESQRYMEELRGQERKAVGRAREAARAKARLEELAGQLQAAIAEEELSGPAVSLDPAIMSGFDTLTGGATAGRHRKQGALRSRSTRQPCDYIGFGPLTGRAGAGRHCREAKGTCITDGRLN